MLKIEDYKAKKEAPLSRSVCPWLSKHYALRTAWRSFCVPLLQYESRVKKNDRCNNPWRSPFGRRKTVYQKFPHNLKVESTHSGKWLYVLCAGAQQMIPKSEEVTITYCHRDAYYRSVSSFHDTICGCPHGSNDDEQHVMSGRQSRILSLHREFKFTSLPSAVTVITENVSLPAESQKITAFQSLSEGRERMYWVVTVMILVAEVFIGLLFTR